jgi:hypothetical protein
LSLISSWQAKVYSLRYYPMAKNLEQDVKSYHIFPSQRAEIKVHHDRRVWNAGRPKSIE